MYAFRDVVVAHTPPKCAQAFCTVADPLNDSCNAPEFDEADTAPAGARARK
jgi:hypothetical protein